MPRKPAIAKETAASVKPARATKSSTPRVKAAQHSKVVPVAAAPALAAPLEKPLENAHEVRIAKIASLRLLGKLVMASRAVRK